MKKLKEFLQTEIKIYTKSEYVLHKNFKRLYVRNGLYHFNGKKFNNAIVIANIESKKPGKGYFSELIKELLNDFPDRVIIVENALEKRFQNKLIRMGFEEGKKETPSEDCFLWKTENKKI